MYIRKAVGRGSGIRKYDLLTVLAVHALAQDKALQRQVLRLMALITARYNWQHDQLSVGQAEIAQLWSVDVRTVKREMAVFRERGWLVEKRPAARGRVALYGLGITRIMEETRDAWSRVGPDLVDRLATPGADETAPPPQSTVIPFPQPTAALAPATAASEGSVWAEVAKRLQALDQSVFRVWFAALEPVSERDELVLRAPSGFHASYVQTHLAGRILAVLAELRPGLGLRIL